MRFSHVLLFDVQSALEQLPPRWTITDGGRCQIDENGNQFKRVLGNVQLKNLESASAKVSLERHVTGLASSASVKVHGRSDIRVLMREQRLPA